MCSNIAILIAQSNLSETGEYLSIEYLELLKALISVVVSASAFYIFDRYWRVKSKGFIQTLQIKNRQRIMKWIGFIIAMSLIYSPVYIYYFVKRGEDYIFRIIWPGLLKRACTWVWYGYALNDTFNNPNLKNLPKLVETLGHTEISLDGPTDSLTIVYVIGESFSRNRSSLYGYPINTNPLMAKEISDSALIVFDNAISYWNSTSYVYRHLLSTCNIQDTKPFESYPLLPALMKKAGYKVAYFDNQQSIANGVGDATCSYFLADYRVRDYCLDIYNDKVEKYDADFVNKFEPTMDSEENNFTIYHLMGQHMQFKERYPESFSHFTKEDYIQFKSLSERGASIMSEFDNATLYNDFTLYTIINKIRDKIAILIYTADHGEEAYDYREAGMRRRDGPITGIRLYHEVPVMIWVSDGFRQKYPGIVSALRRNTHKAIYNNDLPHTILDVTGINTPTFNPDVSLLRDGEGRTHRHVMMHNNMDYDASREKIYRQKLRYEK